MIDTGSQREIEQLSDRLNRWDSRRRLVDSAIWAPRGLLAGLLLSAMVAALARSKPLVSSSELAQITAALAGIGLVLSLSIVWLQKRTDMNKAHFSDRHFGLKERLVTALEIAEGGLQVAPELAEKQLLDSLQASQSVDEKRALPMRFKRQDLSLIAVAIVLLALAMVLENPQSELLAQRREISKAIDEQAAVLEALAEEIEENALLSQDDQQELLAPIESALEEVSKTDLGREEVFAALSESEADLRDLSQNRNPEELIEGLREAGKPLADNPLSQSLGQALQNGSLSSAGQAASLLADQVANLTQDEASALAQSLAESAASMQNMDSELASQLAEAAAALNSGDRQAAEAALRSAAASLQDRAMDQQAASQAAAAADQLAEGMESLAQAGDTQSGGQSGAQAGTGAGDQGGQGSGQQGGSGGGPEGGGDQAGGDQGQAGSGSAGEQGQGAGGPGPGGGHAENVYVPDAVDLSQEAGVDVELPAECRTNPAACGLLVVETPTEFGPEQSLVPYDQVFGDYSQAAYQALDETTIPLGLKGYIRDYFSSLEP